MLVLRAIRGQNINVRSSMPSTQSRQMRWSKSKLEQSKFTRWKDSCVSHDERRHLHGNGSEIKYYLRREIINVQICCQYSNLLVTYLKVNLRCLLLLFRKQSCSAGFGFASSCIFIAHTHKAFPYAYERK